MGRVGRPHGLRGEVAVTLTTDRVERVTPGACLATGDRGLVVESSRPHRGQWLVRFSGVADRQAAETLRGAVLTGEPLDDTEGQLWAHDVIGVEVRDPTGHLLGQVVAVEANPAHDLLVLDDGALVPARFVLTREPDGSLVVDLPAGLLDVNR